MELNQRASRVTLLLMDCDGVLTDGRLYFGPTGEELKVFHARDGEGIVAWNKAGFRSGIISGRNSPIVELRAKQLGIEFIRQGRKDKAVALAEILAESGTAAEDTAYIGDDTPDIQVFDRVGFAAAVRDAHDSVRKAAHFITETDGGRGAVREVIDLLLGAKNLDS